MIQENKLFCRVTHTHTHTHTHIHTYTHTHTHTYIHMRLHQYTYTGMTVDVGNGVRTVRQTLKARDRTKETQDMDY